MTKWFGEARILPNKPARVDWQDQTQKNEKTRFSWLTQNETLFAVLIIMSALWWAAKKENRKSTWPGICFAVRKPWRVMQNHTLCLLRQLQMVLHLPSKVEKWLLDAHVFSSKTSLAWLKLARLRLRKTNELLGPGLFPSVALEQIKMDASSITFR